MPELPEVEMVVRGLRDDVVGRTITGAMIHWPGELWTLSPNEFTDRLVGQKIDNLRRRGKYIVFDLSHDTLLIHLKMSGRLYVTKPDTVVRDDRWTRVTFQLDDGHE